MLIKKLNLISLVDLPFYKVRKIFTSTQMIMHKFSQYDEFLYFITLLK